MNEPEMTREQRILRMMKRVLTDVAKDTYAQPGLKHPLSDNTIQGIRDCLALITAREAELAAETGGPSAARPHFVDEPKTTHVVSIRSVERRQPAPRDADDNNDGG
jgi:hypothetical protein